MVESPSVRSRLLTRTDSMRFFSSRGFMTFAYGFTFASILCMIFLVLNPSSYQITPRIKNALYSSRKYHFSNVFSTIFYDNSSVVSPPPYTPQSHATTHNNEQTSRNEKFSSASVSPSPPQISRKEGSGLITPKEPLRRYGGDGSQSSVQHVHSPSEKSGTQAPPQEPSLTARSPSPTSTSLLRSPTPTARSPSPTPTARSPSPTPTARSTSPTPTARSPSPTPTTRSPPSPTSSPNVDHSKHGIVEVVENECDMFEGSWVRDDSYPLYSAGSCAFIDEPFNCFRNGRKDNIFEKYRWQPKNCNVPRLKGNGMLELLRGKRLVFVGDSLNRNMWESLVCTLGNSLKDKSKMFEASGREEFRTEGSYSIIFTDYNCSIEFFRSPFLVQEWETPDQKGSTKETLRLDLVERSCDKYKDADVLIFNTGHWWTHEKRIDGKGYYQEGNHIHGQMSVEEAFHKALLTWSHWVDSSVDAKKTTVFFRGYSPSHFRGGEWYSGGQCENETEPVKDESQLTEQPPMMKAIESVIKNMKTPVFYLNITRMTDFRRDAHPSLFRNENMTEETKKYMLSHQDCSHWCLPGVPDLWNELVYAHLLHKMNKNKGKAPN